MLRSFSFNQLYLPPVQYSLYSCSIHYNLVESIRFRIIGLAEIWMSILAKWYNLEFVEIQQKSAVEYIQQISSSMLSFCHSQFRQSHHFLRRKCHLCLYDSMEFPSTTCHSCTCLPVDSRILQILHFESFTTLH